LVCFSHKLKGGKCRVHEEHETKQKHSKETSAKIRIKIDFKIMLTRIASSEFQDQNKEMCKKSGAFLMITI